MLEGFKTLSSKKAFLLVFLACFMALGTSASAYSTLPFRSLSIGSAVPSAVTDYTFSFKFQNSQTVGSLKFEFCTSPLIVVACVPPAGFDSSNATFNFESGNTSFSLGGITSNTILLNRPPAATNPALVNIYTFGQVKNPNFVGPYYTRINAYDSINAGGTLVFFGAVVADTTRSVSISTEVPPILNFCSAISIPGDCSTASGYLIQLGNLNSHANSYGSSQFLVGTNAQFGYVVMVSGTTMTSGNNVIPASTMPSLSSPGAPQFGFNLTANTSPLVGANPSGGSGLATANYAIPNHFLFNDSDMIAASNGVSENERYTASYVVNINDALPKGVYNSTLTYICAATF